MGRKAKQFADHVALARVPSILTKSANELHEVLSDTEMVRLTTRLPLLKEPVRRLQERVMELMVERVMDDNGLAAWGSLVRLYGELQRFAEQASAIREGLITHFGNVTEENGSLEPGQTGFQALRIPLDKRVGTLAHTLMEGEDRSSFETLPDRAKECVRVFSRVGGPRNHIDHCEMVDDLKHGNGLREQLEKLAATFSSLVDAERRRTE